MDSIDITDSVFSLDVPQLIGNTNTIDGYDYTMYIYIGSAVLIILIGIFIYRYYKNKQNEEDCPGGFCTMEQNNRQI
jgi:hypothetical protein